MVHPPASAGPIFGSEFVNQTVLCRWWRRWRRSAPVWYSTVLLALALPESGNWFEHRQGALLGYDKLELDFGQNGTH